MAITINGTANTVAGVAAGGINDNVVDNGTMADDAIGVAELSATGTASASTFLCGNNTWAAAGGGKVLQVKGAEEGNYVVNPSGYTTFFDLDITPESASSKFIVNVSSFYMLNDGREIQIRCRDSNSTYVGGLREFKNASGGDIKGTLNTTWYMDQSYSTGSATTFIVEFDDNGDTTAVGSSSTGWKSTMVIYEVEI